MVDISKHIYTERDQFFFDSDVYTDDGTHTRLDYEDGDMIKWVWEGKKMTGVLRQENQELGLFYVEVSDV